MSHFLYSNIEETAGGAWSLPRRVVLGVLLKLSRTEIVKGFEVSSLDGSLTPQMIAQLRIALELIDKLAPCVLARLHQDVRRILFVSTGGPEYWPFADGFILNARFAAESEIEFIALTIVHEGMHARLQKCGIRYTPTSRERIERICVRYEAAFASRLPDAAYFSDYVVQKLATPWWTDEKALSRQARAREALWPRWVARVHEKLFGRTRRV